MKFSTKSSYGLRVMVKLAQNYYKNDNKPYSLAKIAKEEGISLAYLEQIIAKLKSAGFVKSHKGLKGGYQLIQNPKQIKIAQIFKVLEGSIAPFFCVEKKNLKCQSGCCGYYVWQKLYQSISKTLNSINLQEVINKNL